MLLLVVFLYYYAGELANVVIDVLLLYKGFVLSITSDNEKKWLNIKNSYNLRKVFDRLLLTK